MNGVLLINKEAGMTSHDVVNRLRRILHIKRIGHSGTLDPDATGVLLVLIGKACKVLPFLPDTDKEYIATMALGQRTLSDDIWGEVLETKEVTPITIFHGLCYLLIVIQQLLPPIMSIVRVYGRKLYEYARAHEEVERPLRTIDVYEMEALDEQALKFRVFCSSGTYVRSLCRDMAEASGNLGCLSSLVRSRVGRFSLDDCCTLQQVEEGDYSLLPVETLLTHLPRVSYAPIQDIYNGKSVHLDAAVPKGRICMYDQEQAVAIYEYSHGDVYRCVRGIW